DKLSTLKEIKRVLGKSGRLAIIDWKKIEMDFGPPFEERFDEKEVIGVCHASGFKIFEQSYAGRYNYLLIFGTSGDRNQYS
ncbi:MAG: hypothetical protein QSU88_01015, partial [Candidatus Methanoperedens sp.]|nr:hypothetical protein [Candidatus Methanoperedens sp.]